LTPTVPHCQGLSYLGRNQSGGGLALRELGSFDNQTKAKRNVVRAVGAVSKMLGNTPATCLKCYVHPAVFDGYLDGSLLQALNKRADERLANSGVDLKAEEAAVMGFLSRQLAATERVSLRQRRARRAPTLERRQQLNTTIVILGGAKRDRESRVTPTADYAGAHWEPPS
jgi:hypothetical protein